MRREGTGPHTHIDLVLLIGVLQAVHLSVLMLSRRVVEHLGLPADERLLLQSDTHRLPDVSSAMPAG